MENEYYEKTACFQIFLHANKLGFQFDFHELHEIILSVFSKIFLIFSHFPLIFLLGSKDSRAGAFKSSRDY